MRVLEDGRALSRQRSEAVHLFEGDASHTARKRPLILCTEEAEGPHAKRRFNAEKNRIQGRPKVIDIDQTALLTNFSNLCERVR